jgi:hypothetical protein
MKDQSKAKSDRSKRASTGNQTVDGKNGKVMFVKDFPTSRSLRKKMPPWVEVLKKRPKEWAMIFSSKGGTSSASSTASRMRIDVRYVGFEFRASGKNIYARWMGDGVRERTAR